MRRRRLRSTIRRMMVAVAIIAAALAWAITRPYPTEGEGFGSVGWYVFWSDGSWTAEDGPGALNFRGNSWFHIVDWPDGRTRYYLVVR